MTLLPLFLGHASFISIHPIPWLSCLDQRYALPSTPLSMYKFILQASSFKFIFSASPVVDHVPRNSYCGQCVYFCNIGTSFGLIWILATLVHIYTACLRGEWNPLRQNCAIDIFISHVISQTGHANIWNSFSPNPFRLWPLQPHLQALGMEK